MSSVAELTGSLVTLRGRGLRQLTPQSFSTEFTARSALMNP